MTIRIPNENKKFSIPNNSDLFGNIQYTKNMNFDEEGYAKLSSRTIAIINEADDADFDLPTSLGRTSAGEDSNFYVVTTDDPFDVALSNATFSGSQDTDNGGDSPPTFTTGSNGRWWQNKWHVTTGTKLYHKNPSNGNWTNTNFNSSLSMNTNFSHPLEVFRSRTTLCIGDGNLVRQTDTGYAASTTLTLPSDYEVVKLAYSNQLMGVATRLSSEASGQNQEAYLFIWDGATGAANGSYPVGSDAIIDICAYKSSFLILTRTGQIKYFNSGGFDEVVALPFYYLPYIWGDPINREALGDILHVEGELIFINVNNKMRDFGTRREEYIQASPAGVLCYDPKIGLYHRYSHSASKGSLLLVTSGNINTTTDTFTKTSGTIPITGSPVKYVSNDSNPITPLDCGAVYYIIKISSTEFRLASTKEDAIALTPINITGTGASNNYFLALDLVDYGASRIDRTGAVGFVGTTSHVFDHLVLAADVYRIDASTNYPTLGLTISEFENRGYFVTAKIPSAGINDNSVNVYVKFRPLKVNDKVIVKSKHEDVIGLPVTTPQTSTSCTWSDENTFTTTADLSDVKEYLDADTTRECEAEIISGAGAGQMAQISTITENSGTYTVQLAEDIDGAASGRVCDVCIDNWKKWGEIDSSNIKGWDQFQVPVTSKWVKFKTEFRGVETTLEELIINNTVQKPIGK